MTEQNETRIPTELKYQPHLKRILHDYKKSSKTGLNGPAGYTDSMKNKTVIKEANPTRTPSPQPIRYPSKDDVVPKKKIAFDHPFYYPPDCSRSCKKEAILEG